MAKLEKNGIQRQIATLSDISESDSVEDYVAEHGGECGTPLPENIVIDPDYVHTDNNYDNDAAEKLAGLQNYDDTDLNEAIASVTARATAAETALAETDEGLRQSIDAETQRATSAEEGLQESITSVIARATAAETALSETDNELRQSIDAETQRAANVETALTPKSWNWDYVMRNMAPQNTADAVIIATTWGYLDAFGNKTEQTFPFALPMADSTQAGVMSKEQAQQILDNTSAIGLIRNAGYINNAALLSAIQSAKDYAESLIANQVSGFLIYKYEVDTFSDLPAGLTDENNGWLYHIKDTGAGYYWFGGEWNQLDASVDLSGYATEDYVNTAISNIPEYVLPQATDTVLGGVKSSSISGKGYIEGTGVISINGWDALNASVSNLSNNKQNLLSTGQLNAANSGITNTKVSDYDTHISDAVKHITSAERTAWNGKQNALIAGQLNAANSGITAAKVSDYDTHISDAVKHITSAERAAWNAKPTMGAGNTYITLTLDPDNGADGTNVCKTWAGIISKAYASNSGVLQVYIKANTAARAVIDFSTLTAIPQRYIYLRSSNDNREQTFVDVSGQLNVYAINICFYYLTINQTADGTYEPFYFTNSTVWAYTCDFICNSVRTSPRALLGIENGFQQFLNCRFATLKTPLNAIFGGNPRGASVTVQTCSLRSDSLAITYAANRNGSNMLYQTADNVKAANGTSYLVPPADYSYVAVNIFGSATKLQNARTFQTNLGSTAAASFDGSANITPGIAGTLGVANGGTGATSIAGILGVLFNTSNTTQQTYVGTFGSGYANSGYTSCTSLSVGSAAKWATVRIITLSGAVSGSASIDGSANVSIVTTRNAPTMTTLFSGSAGSGTITLSAALSNYKEVLIVVANTNTTGSYKFLWQGSVASLGYVAAGEYISIPAAYSASSTGKMPGVDITAANGTLASSTSWTIQASGATVKYVIGIS